MKFSLHHAQNVVVIAHSARMPNLFCKELLCVATTMMPTRPANIFQHGNPQVNT